MAEVIVLGTCVTDLISYTPRFPIPGETIVANGFHKGFGGKGANTAFMVRSLDLKVELLAKIGDDQFGQEHNEYLQSVDVGTSHLTIAKGFQTAVSTITVASNGENTIVYSAGAADELKPSDVDDAEETFKKAKVFASVFETNLENVLRGVQIAKRHNLTTYVNAAPIHPYPIPKECFPLIDYLCINEIEGNALINQFLELPRTMGDQEIVDFLLQQGVRTVIMTKGSQGAAYASLDSPLLKLVPVRKVENVVDTTGAGDAFNGGFIYQLVRNSSLEIEEKVQKACGIASLSVEKKGTQSSYPKKCEVPAAYL